jgi:SHS2 domain-containing protein
MGRYEVLEHTADVGLRVEGSDLKDLFKTAAEGMTTIAGVYRPGEGEMVPLSLESPDLEALLVDWLNEVLFQHDSRGAGVRGIGVENVSDTALRGSVSLAPLEAADEEGVQIKAVTYHLLGVRRTSGGWEATVYFDV